MAAPIESGYFASPGPTTVAAAHARPTETQSASTSPTEITGTNSSSRRRGSSITQSLFDANPPPGVWAATGEAIARGPGLAELRRNSSSGGSGPGIIRRMSSSGGSRNGKRKRRESSTSAASPGSDSESGAGSSKSPGNGSKSPRAKGRLHSIFFEELDENNSEEKRASRMSLTSSLSGSGLRESNRDSARPVSRQPENVYSLIEAGERSQTGERSQAGEAPARVSTNIQSRGIDRTSTAGTGRSEGQEREQNPGWMAVTIQALKSFWSWFLTPMVRLFIKITTLTNSLTRL